MFLFGESETQDMKTEKTWFQKKMKAVKTCSMCRVVPLFCDFF